MKNFSRADSMNFVSTADAASVCFALYYGYYYFIFMPRKSNMPY